MDVMPCKASSRVWLFVVLVGILPACSDGAGRPVAAVQALVEATRSGDVEEIWKLLGPQTRRRLEDGARRAGLQAGRRRITARDLLAVGWSPPRFIPAEVHEVERNGDVAWVEVTGPQGERERVQVIREKDDWKVELP
jgi:hypothetical protein